jgi:hypothetical protein
MRSVLRVDDEHDLSAADGLASASNSLAPASPSPADTFPTREIPFTRGVLGPDFDLIPSDQWEAAMRTVPQRLRINAINGAGMTMAEKAELGRLAMSDLPPAPSDLAREEVLRKPQLAPRPAADHFRRANRQINFRLTEKEYADLATAAELIGTTPTQLAGQLVRNGIGRVIAEANRPVR